MNITGPVEFSLWRWKGSSEWGCQCEGLFAGVSQWFPQLISRAAEVNVSNVICQTLTWIWLVATDVTGIVLIFWSREDAESSLQCYGSRETVVPGIIPEASASWCLVWVQQGFSEMTLAPKCTCDLPLPKPLSLTLRWVRIQHCHLPVIGEGLRSEFRTHFAGTCNTEWSAVQCPFPIMTRIHWHRLMFSLGGEYARETPASCEEYVASWLPISMRLGEWFLGMFSIFFPRSP